MSLSTEVLLPLAVLAFYLFDSSMLLFSNEVMFVNTGNGWRATTGSGFQFRGRYVYLPNALTPHHGAFRAHWTWTPSATTTEHIPGLQHFVGALASLRKGCVLLWALLLVALPFLLAVYPHPVALLALLGSVYATVAAIILSAYRYRGALQLTTKDIAALALEGFACPPFAINTVRKVCLRREIKEGAVAFAARLLRPEDFAKFRVAIGQRVSASIDFEDDGSPKRTALIALNDHLRDWKS